MLTLEQKIAVYNLCEVALQYFYDKSTIDSLNAKEKEYARKIRFTRKKIMVEILNDRDYHKYVTSENESYQYKRKNQQQCPTRK